MRKIRASVFVSKVPHVGNRHKSVNNRGIRTRVTRGSRTAHSDPLDYSYITRSTHAAGNFSGRFGLLLIDDDCALSAHPATVKQADAVWGMCTNCNRCQVEPDANADNATMGICAKETETESWLMGVTLSHGHLFSYLRTNRFSRIRQEVHMHSQLSPPPLTHETVVCPRLFLRASSDRPCAGSQMDGAVLLDGQFGADSIS